MTTYHPQLVASTGSQYQYLEKNLIDNDAQRSQSIKGASADVPCGRGVGNGPFYFKSAQWSSRSPDGTTILTSSADLALRSFIAPPDLLTSSAPHDLKPYSSHVLPEAAYATMYYPGFSLQEPSTTLFLASLPSLPIRLYSTLADTKVASYPLVSPTTEAFIPSYSLLFSTENPNHFFTGNQSCISVFDIHRDGEGPFQRMHTIPSQRGGASGIGGFKGIVSALAINADGLLAAGTFNRWVGLYDTRLGETTNAIFSLEELSKNGNASAGKGTGITQVLWSSSSRYLCVVERGSDGIGVWDIRGSGQRLAWLSRRKALTPQRLGAEIFGDEVWAGGLDGVVRAWKGIGTTQGVVEPSWEFKAHDDAICATTLHQSGTVLATASGQQHHPMGLEGLSGDDEDHEESLSRSHVEPPAEICDNSLKIWTL